MEIIRQQFQTTTMKLLAGLLATLLMSGTAWSVDDNSSDDDSSDDDVKTEIVCPDDANPSSCDDN